MFRSALNRLGAHSLRTGMIGDRMDTDVVAGIEAGLHTVLVLTGIADRAAVERYPFRPKEILDSVADLLEDDNSTQTAKNSDEGKGEGKKSETKK